MTLPLPNLDDKTFTQLVEEAKKLIHRFTPEWTDYNIHDPGITFIELFAWLTEGQQYYLDQIRDQNYLKFLKLLGPEFEPRDATLATADLTFSFIDEKKAKESILVPEGTKVSADNVVFETLEALWITNFRIAKIISESDTEVMDHTELNNQIGLWYYPFGDNPQIGNKLYLGFTCNDGRDNEFFTKQNISITFNLIEDYPVARGIHGTEQVNITPSAVIKWYYYGSNDKGNKGWYPLNLVRGKNFDMCCSGKITYNIPDRLEKLKNEPALDPELYWIVCTVQSGHYELPPKIDNILLNTVTAEQRETVFNLLLGKSNGLPKQKFYLEKTPVISDNRLVIQVYEKDTWQDWQQVKDFHSSKPFDRHYTLNSGSGEIVFGDGINGAIPPVPEVEELNNIRAASVSFGGGIRGNLSPGKITNIVDPSPNLRLLSVTNQRAAAGGNEAESLKKTILRARRELKEEYRAVTSEDYERLAYSTPGLRLARAKAIPLYAPQENGKLVRTEAAVTVIVVPYSTNMQPQPSEGFLETVCRHLDEHRLITTRIFVRRPEYVAVNVSAAVVTKDVYDTHNTHRRIEIALRKFLNPLSGGPDGTGWPFGRDVYKSEIYAVIENVEGVDYVKSLVLSAGGAVPDTNGIIHVEQYNLVYLGDSSIEVSGPKRKCRVRGEDGYDYCL